MQHLSKLIAVVLLAGASVATQAQNSSDADRRARNREEAIASHHGMPSGSSEMRTDSYRPYSSDDSARARTHRAADSARSTTHRAANKTRGFTHRQANKLRNFGARTNAKYPAPERGVDDTNKTPSALGK